MDATAGVPKQKSRQQQPRQRITLACNGCRQKRTKVHNHHLPAMLKLSSDSQGSAMGRDHVVEPVCTVKNHANLPRRKVDESIAIQ
jgi:hypothetical protein